MGCSPHRRIFPSGFKLGHSEGHRRAPPPHPAGPLPRLAAATRTKFHVSKRKPPAKTPGSDPRLRSAAEEQLARSRGTARALPAETSPGIIHELEVHQIELEMQNDELKQASLALEESRDRYVDLFDFAPVGYFSFTREGRIIEVNLTGATLLGVPRAELIGRALGSFIAPEDRDRWKRHLGSVLQAKAPPAGVGGKQSCELRFERQDGGTFHARLESVRQDRPPGPEPAGAGGGNPVIRAALSDITEQVRAEEALRQSEERYELAVRGSMDGIWDWNILTNEDYFSDRWCELVGYQRSELRPHVDTWRNLLHPDDRARVHDRLRRHLEQKEPYEVDFRMLTKGGDYRWFRARGQALWNARGQPTRMAGALTDITERKAAEEVLHRYELFSGHSRDIWLFLRHADGRILEANAAAVNNYGYSREKLLTLTIHDLRAPDAQKLTAGQMTQADTQGILFETVHRCHDGSTFPVEVSTRSATIGDTRLLVSVVRDITDRKRAEEMLVREREFSRALLENAGDGVVACDAQGQLVLFNKTAREWHGLDARSVPPHEWADHYDLFGADGRTRLRPEDVPLLRAFRGERVRDARMSIAARGQPVRYIIANSDSFGDPQGAKLGAVVVMRDITESKRAEEKLQEATQELARSNEELEQFAYVASHDLQEPLRAVTGYLGLLETRLRDKLDDKGREYMNGAVEGALRMGALITDLLALSRAGTQRKTLVSADLNQVLDQALRSLSVSVRETGAKITRDALPVLRMDRSQMAQLFQNLIGNALKFRGQGAPEVHVGAQREPKRWLLTVRDNGIGIEPKDFQRIFLIFQRLHTRQEYPGTGIGLALCKKIVERHGGSIWVESQAGQGSTFSFTIPDK
jgi:PAS domain S-box-containing protein